MGWLSSLFSSGEYSRNGQTLSSTHEAFSLPTSSPTLPPHPDVYTPTSPDLDPNNPSYTYPPQGPSPYSYVRTSRGLNSRPASASLLPVHRPPVSTKLSYPPLSHTWDRIRSWLNREYPELGDTLNYGILPQDLAQAELQFGFALPPVLRESYLCVDGQEAESAAGCSEGLFFGLKLLPLEDVLEEWRFWREVDNDPTTGANPHLRQAMQSIPPGWVRKTYSQRGWIPLIADKAGNYVGVDLDPDEKGSLGQVIVFGRDFDTKVVLWRGDGPTGWAKWLASFADELESGEGTDISTGNDGSEDSEDDVGYESYFYDGTGRGQGDGGGDMGSGAGLRLNGEYRGWNVLEAWADRSLKRWHEAGVVADVTPNMQAETSLDKKNTTSIPFLADDEEYIPDPTSSALATGNHARPISSRDVPTISVTKAPAPRPVALPMPDDILPISDSSSSSFDEDLESGHSPRTHDVFQDDLNVVPGYSKSLPAQSNAESGRSTSSELSSLSGDISPAARSRSTSSADIVGHLSAAGAGTARIPDLMATSVPVMPTRPIAPSSPAPSQAELTEAGEGGTAAEAVAVQAPDTTVGLVGGGGVVDTVSDVSEIDRGPEMSSQKEKTTQIDVTVPATESATAQSGKTTPTTATHKKAMSGLAGLKKLGGMRKRDSGSSVKGTA